MCGPTENVVKAKVGQNSNKSKPTNTASEPVIYLNLPGDYSGDIWHVAAALVVDCRVHVVFTMQSTEKTSKDYQTVEKAKAFFLNCGIRKERFHEVKVPAMEISMPKARSLVSSMAIDVDDEPIQRDIFSARTHQVEAAKAMKQPVHAVYSSTYIWVQAIETKGRDVVLKAIKAAFVLGFEGRQPKEAKAIRDRIAEVTSGAERFMFVNMRMASYHPEDNTSRWVYEQIAGVANNSKQGVRLIRVGSFNSKDKVHTGPHGSWMEDLATECVDIYRFCTLKSGWADMQSVAYFWAQVASMPGCLGVAGGRSGSSDIAGLMGNKLLCWTICRPPDPGYQRQQIMVGKIMSLIDMNANISKYETTRKHVTAEFNKCSGLLVDAVKLCFQGEPMFGPHCYPALTPVDRELHDMVKSPYGTLSFCMVTMEEAQLGAIEVSKAAYNAKAVLSKTYTIGFADGIGLNCLLRSLYQLKHGDGEDKTEQGETAIANYRKFMVDTFQVTEDDELDFIAHGPQVLRELEIRVRLIRIDSRGNLQDTGLEMGNGDAPLHYILYEGDGWSGHFTPMYPK